MISFLPAGPSGGRLTRITGIRPFLAPPMMQTSKADRVAALYRYLSSKILTLSLFGLLIVVLVPKTLVSKKVFFLDGAVSALLAAIGINLVFCTIRRFKAISVAVLIVHLGIFVVLAGALISARGYVATVNVYEGGFTDTFYRWDLEKDIQPGFTLGIDKIHQSYYPVGVKVGVLRGKEKAGLFTLKTGESFTIDGYRIGVGALDMSSGSLTLQVHDSNARLIGSYDTRRDRGLPPGFPYAFKLVAFQNPVLKRVWTDLRLLRDNRVVARGVSEVNHPFTWNGLRFFTTRIDVDDAGMPYVGIQIIRDPGVSWVYGGFILICLGVLACLRQFIGRGRRGRARQPWKRVDPGTMEEYRGMAKRTNMPPYRKF